MKNHQGPSKTNHKNNREFSNILLEILGLLHGPSTSYFFVNFDFSYFFCIFLKMSNINVDSIRKINYFKNDTEKVERVQKTFENLNYFETAENAKNDANILKTYF